MTSTIGAIMVLVSLAVLFMLSIGLLVKMTIEMLREKEYGLFIGLISMVVFIVGSILLRISGH